MNVDFYRKFLEKAIDEPWAKFKFERLRKSVAKETIVNYHSKNYFEALVKLIIYKDDKTVTGNEDDWRWLDDRLLRIYRECISLNKVV